MDARDTITNQLTEENAQLKTMLEKYMLVFDSASQGIVVLVENRVTLINRKAIEIMGFGPDENSRFIGMAFIDFVHPDDQAMVAENHTKRLKGEHPPDSYDIRIFHKNKDSIWVGISPVRIMWEDKSAVLIHINDISERKAAETTLQESETRFRTLFEMSPQPIFLTDLETGRIISINDKFCEISGYSREEVIGKTTIEIGFFDERTREEFISNFMEAGEVNGLEGVYALKSGGRIHVLQYCKLLKLNEQKIIFTIIADITEKKQMEERLRQAQKMEAIGTLSGGIAHDFNNILTIIVGNTELAMDKMATDNPNFGKLKNILNASFRARDVVTQLVSFSRSSNDENLPMEIDHFVKESIRLLMATIPRNIEIRKKITENIGKILANPVHINQIMINLCNNAVEAMRETGGILEIGLKAVHVEHGGRTGNRPLTPGPYVLLWVSDTGTGIEPDIRERIFEPYFTTRQFGQGNGMGLSVAYGVVKNLSGEIFIESEVGKGTRVDIFLPRIKTVPRDREPVDDNTPSASTKKKNLLFVDDEELIVEIAHQLLENLGYNVESTTNPIEAFAQFESRPDHFDLIITDTSMPQLNGDQLIKNILSIRPDMPVILCSGYNEMISEEGALDLGAKAFLMKPIRRDGLDKTIRRVLAEQKKVG